MLRTALQGWRAEFFDGNMVSLTNGPRTDGYCKAVVFYYHCAALTNLCLALISWSAPSAVNDLEQEAYSWACDELALMSTSDKVYWCVQGALYMNHKTRVAESVIQTHADWQLNAMDDSNTDDTRTRLIPK